MNTINIIEGTDGELRVSSLVIAGRTENQHKNVLDLIDRYHAELSGFGRVAFETRPFETAGGTQHREIRLLNEQQSTLLLAFMRNSPIVVGFKVELVKQFYAMRQALISTPALPASYADALRELASTVEQNEALEAKVAEDAPKVAYHDRFVAEEDDLVKVDLFASQYGSTGPKVRALMIDRGVAVRRYMGKRWSKSKGEMEKVYEWRPVQGKPSHGWFDVRPQNDAPRMHNGQVQQTMYVRQFYAEALAKKLGLIDLELEEQAA